MTYLSEDNNILDLRSWRQNKKELSSKTQDKAQKNYFKALNFEQIMSEAQKISSDLSQSNVEINMLKEAVLLLTEIESRLKKDNTLIFSQELETMINGLDAKINNLDE